MNDSGRYLGYRYEIQQKLGQGGMGVVYRAYDRLMGESVALKRVTNTAEDLFLDAADTDANLNLAREFQTLASLRHPHIISVLDYGFDLERQPYFTMTLLEQPKTIEEASKFQEIDGQITLLIQTLEALAYLHRRGVVHRDLKPGNVMVTPEGQVKVLDFGLAVAREQQAGTSGTLAYMAPEIMQGGAASPASDLYAIGVLAYELLTGSHPFGSNTSQLLLNILGRPPDIDKLPENLAGVIARLLEKEPERRYQHAQEVIGDLSRASGRPLPPESEAIRESFLQAATFVGRESELNSLTQALSEAVAGRGSAWLIGGESGVGKSRLLDELRILALVQGATVLRGQAVEGGGLPYQLWRTVVPPLALAGEMSDLNAAILKEIVPHIGRLLHRPILDAPTISGSENQQRLISTLLSLFKSQQQPMLLLLEDLQWATESLIVLQQLIKAVPDLPLLIVANYRDDERPNLPGELPGMTPVKLNRLTEPETASLIESMLGEPGQQSGVLERLLKETEGNAFFLVEVVRALAEEAGRLSRIGQTALPDKVFAGGVQTIIRRRLQRAPDWARPLLRPAAVAGRELDLALLQHIAANQPDYFPQEMALDNWLNGCTEAAILDVQEGHWRFAHDKLRQALLDDLPEEERPALHRLVAQTIEIIQANNLDDYAYILFEHWQAAGSQEKESYYAWLAGKQVHTADQFQEAERLLRHGLALTPEHDSQHRARLLLALGNTLERQGKYDLSRQSLESALPLAASESAEYMELLNRLSLIYLRQDQYQLAQEYGQTALKLARQQNDRLKTGSILSNLGDLAWAIGEYKQAEGYMQEGLDIGREIENSWLMSICFNGLGLLAWVHEEYELARHYIEQSKALEEKVGNRWGVSISLLNLGELAYIAGDYEGASEFLNQSLIVQQEVGNRPVMAEIYSNLGITAGARGDNEMARRYLLEALDHAYETNTTSGVLKTLAALAGVRAGEGDWQGAAEWLGLALHHPASNSNVQGAARPTVELLKEKLPPDQYESALVCGQSLDLDTVVEEIRGMKTPV